MMGGTNSSHFSASAGIMGATFTIDALWQRAMGLLGGFGTSRPFEPGDHCIIRM